MSYALLIWSELWRKPLRTAFLVASLAAAFMLFGIVDGVDSAFDAAIKRQRLDRVLVGPKFSQPPLPRSYSEQIERLPRVTGVVGTAFLVGYYNDPKNRVLVITTDPDRFFRIRDEIEVPPLELAALSRTRTGIVVLDTLASKYGWKVGDKVTLKNATDKSDGTKDWTFDLVGLMSSPSNPSQIGFGVANYAYLDEARVADKGTVNRFVVQVDDPRRAIDVGSRIDRQFESAAAPTRTTTENESARAQLASVGEVSLVARAVIAAVFIAILLLAGNTVAEAVRERSLDLAVLKTIGYSNGTIVALVTAECFVIVAVAAVAGLVIATAIFSGVSQHLPDVSAYVGTARLSAPVYLGVLGWAALLALLCAAVPAWNIVRLNVANAMALR